uniref:Uncharacterized protein n=1 Tax=Anguilla anguilla TaxID=7936 RepID=A0A0E9R6E0_ANGAN
MIAYWSDDFTFHANPGTIFTCIFEIVTHTTGKN